MIINSLVYSIDVGATSNPELNNMSCYRVSNKVTNVLELETFSFMEAYQFLTTSETAWKHASLEGIKAADVVVPGRRH